MLILIGTNFYQIKVLKKIIFMPNFINLPQIFFNKN